MPASVRDPDFVRGMHTVSSWADVNFALKAPQMHVGRKIRRSILENILVMTNGDNHLHRRRIESKVFGRKALGIYEKAVLAPVLAEQAETWGKTARGELVDDTLVLLSRMGGRVTGLDDIDTTEKARALIVHSDEFAAAGSVEWARISDGEKQALIDRAEASREEFEQRFVLPAKARREELLRRVAAGELDAAELSNDVITVLLSNWREEWAPELLSLELLMFLSGSIRTTMRAVCNSVQEIHDWIAEHPADAPRLADPVFVRQAVNETLRLHVVVPVLLRLTADDVTMPSGLSIPANEYVAILYAHANRDPSAFGDDAELFDPHRAERETKGRDYGVSFVVGAHACIGRRVAVGSGDEDSSNTGTVMTIMRALLDLGVTPDSDNPPQPNDQTFYDEYKKYPVRFTKP